MLRLAKLAIRNLMLITQGGKEMICRGSGITDQVADADTGTVLIR